MGRRAGLTASTASLLFALAMPFLDVSVGLSTGDWLNLQTYAFWIGIALVGGFLLLWTWKRTPSRSDAREAVSLPRERCAVPV